ncbi:iron complex outermembrane recepter protein [Andreprevotia lacus DSM 23236]|jgi:iron complex outermembrane receptor protein|uniref:Iron complex outermembrane recepter protein n=1 Tax=Andreprevotia lacus DSM 23236 TaxID=1121001 RepID=A0A1W1XZC8_9NEIS|nr:TonB-dependent receptor [Andreprevotia lacus]SMC29329.1 iron complex outermembrane recepter protein [Andreprevotia lacus DSM 23236]
MRRLLPALLLGAAITAQADDAAELQPVVVSATRVETPASDVPAAVSQLGRDDIQAAQPTINLSEALQRLPGVVAQNRQNYAQDVQLSVRGFGARSTFGVRGVRIVVDGIPATMPDGQAQTSHIDLASAEHIELLRGPFSVLYGNAAGGTLLVNSESGQPGNAVTASVAAGSDGARKNGIKASGLQGGINYLLDANRFSTDGYRDHSAATRDLLNGKLVFGVGEQGVATLVVNSVRADADDPLGLSRAQYEANPQQADASALRYNTRKALDQQQFGASLDQPLGDADTLHASLYAGQRATTQFQAITPGAQTPAGSAGGVIDLQRRYQGVDANWLHQGEGWHVVAGVNVEALDEARKGYENFVGSTLGVQGRLRRDESNRVWNADQYLQLQWQPAERWRLDAGVRNSSVHVRSTDHYIAPGNGDDSGSVTYKHLGGALGINYRAAEALNLYAAYGQGFETPTLNELSYRATSGGGLNWALQPAESDHYEVGAKWQPAAGTRVELALFHVDTRNELVVLANAGGRAVYQNAARTRRDGIELSAHHDWTATLSSTLAYSWLRAEYAQAFASCSGTPCTATTVPAGKRLPGIPGASLFADLAWQPADGALLALETVYSGSMMVNDANSDARASYWLINLRAGLQQKLGAWRFKEFVRLDNLLEQQYAGSVIVNESNGRYFEPAPGRSVFAGVSATLDW